jgi:tRNA 2-thiouridine synthesizing protein A
VTGIEADSSLTVTGEKCPMNYVRVKLKLETLAEGQVLEALVDQGEAARNVPRSAREEGHEVLLIESLSKDAVRVLIRKREVDRVA